MSKKTRKPRTGAKQAATPQKSSRAVETDDVNEARPVDNQQDRPEPVEMSEGNAVSENPSLRSPDEEVARQQSTVPHDEEAVGTKPPSASAAPVSRETSLASSAPPSSSAVVYQSIVPPTDDIDDAWGSEQAGESPSPAPFAASSAPITPVPQPSEPAVSANADSSAEPDDERTVTDAHVPSSERSEKNPVAVAAGSTAAAVETEPSRRSAAPVSARSSVPAALRPSYAPASTPRAGAGSGAEIRASRAPGSLRAAISPFAGVRRASAPPSAPRASVAPAGEAKPAPPTQPVAEGGLAQPQLQVPAVQQSVAASSPATTTPIAEKTPLEAPGNGQPALLPISISTNAPVTATGQVPSSIPPKSNRNSVWAMLWLASVAAAGALGWFMRPVPHPAKAPVKCDCAQQPVLPGPAAAVQTSAIAVSPTPSPSQSVPAATPSAAVGDADAGDTSPVASANAPASTLPVVVQTESADRINVVVSSRPNGVRVWRRGKEIGRTPLIIQIGRGERRAFEVGSPGYGTRRLQLDGEKTEVTVNLFAPGVK